MRNLHKDIERLEMDSVLCEMLDIPRKVYDVLPGEKNSKFFSNEEYRLLTEKGINRYDLLKKIEIGWYDKNLTLCLDGDVKKRISCTMTRDTECFRKMYVVELSGIKNGHISSEHFEFVYDNREFVLDKYSGARAQLSMSDEEIATKIKKIPNPNSENDYKNFLLYMFRKEPYKVLDRDVVVGAKYPMSGAEYVYINDVVLSSNKSIDKYLQMARQEGMSMIDFLLEHQHKKGAKSGSAKDFN